MGRPLGAADKGESKPMTKQELVERLGQHQAWVPGKRV
jgi:hypothetical protein